MAKSLRVLLVGGPMYDPLYARLEEFEAREGIDVEAVVVPSHPDLNERIEEEFGSGAASYDLLSTHAGLPHLRDTRYGPRPARRGRAAAFPHLARVASVRGQAWNAPGVQRLSRGCPVRSAGRFAGRAEVGVAGGGAGGGSHPAQAQELSSGGGRHLAGRPRGAPGEERRRGAQGHRRGGAARGGERLMVREWRHDPWQRTA
jgi:hypothetical protein